MSQTRALCRHELAPDQCGLCRPRGEAGPRQVVITAGGYAFHSSASCELLREGQEIVSRRGGRPEPIERVAYVEAVAVGREPCRGCYPGGWPSLASR
jgi:hypothetical protein